MATPNARGSMENKSSIGAANMLPVSSQVAYPKDKYAGMSPSAIRELLLVKPRPKPINNEKPGFTNSITTIVRKPQNFQIRGPDVDEITPDKIESGSYYRDGGGVLYKKGSDKPYNGYLSYKGRMGKGQKEYLKQYYVDGIVASSQNYGLDDLTTGPEKDFRPKKRKGLMSKFLDVISPADDSYSE